jgi:hypothetical protein
MAFKADIFKHTAAAISAGNDASLTFWDHNAAMHATHSSGGNKGRRRLQSLECELDTNLFGPTSFSQL